MTMVIRNELRMFDQIVTSVSFGPKIGKFPPPPPRNAGTLKTMVCQPLHWQSCRLGGGEVLDQMTTDFLKGMEYIIFKVQDSYLHLSELHT